MAMKVEMIDELLKNCKTSDDIFGENGLVKVILPRPCRHSHAAFLP